ncbi:MAG TPA: SdpI family protein [Candidatus Faecousia intestinigallinarum]|nr:SdpI family protein [Candidatus Faecousia intestinigallinarum]
MDKIMGLLEGFDPAALLPDLSNMMGTVNFLLRLAVLIGPIVVLVLGLCYFFLSPKEANHSFGYRFFWGMSSVEAWRFMQKLAGLVWGGLGLILLVVMLIVCASFGGMETMDMVWSALTCVLWELGLLIAASLAVDITLIVRYDRKGARRTKKEK